MSTTLRNRIITFLLVIAAALVFLVPTFYPEKFKGKEGIRWLSRPINLGLDLSGGVHLLYEVQAHEAVRSRLGSTAQAIRADLREDRIATTKSVVNDKDQVEITVLSERFLQKAKEKIDANHQGLLFVDQQVDGERGKLIYGISPKEAAETEVEAIRQAIETLRNRVDQFGVSEPLITKVGTDRIMLQMPGVQDIESVKRAVGSVAKLEFKLIPSGGDLSNTVRLKDRSGATVTVEDQALMSGDAVKDARVSIPQGQVDVNLALNAEGTQTFRKITEENVGRQLAIILDNVVYSSPVIREPIPGGNASISGHFTIEEATQLAVVLRSGALPAPLKVLEERTVGPSLGKDSIQKGIMAMIIGIAAVFIFMVLYYGKAGALASVSLVLNVFLLLAILSAFGATLTLPGLAGLALTAGMAVDSNVIIFERIRDELKLGATRDAAVKAGFEKAFSAIFDSNITTLLSGIILYALGSGTIKGFAVTLNIGILTTIYCAVYAARLGFDVFPLTNRSGKLSI